MNTKSLDFYEPLEIDGQKYIKMTKKEDQGVYEAGVTQEAFTAKDKYDYKRNCREFGKIRALYSSKLYRTIQM
ncbi:BAF_HP2_G0025210.mRNA.1.CDS.1 [Saccharomyces cerevisiae]|nr:BAF_HP2_G0025210.mRNA.1.CDS.1 [Saccharomyces cerevisiae]CAI6577999.1 BAF_HP2_G0025210.mRNA.1.CDS.1 [Saccharomyces cerevisiae]